MLNWIKMIFSNETNIEMHSDKREFVRKLKGKRNDAHYNTKTVKFAVQSIMLWRYRKKNDGPRKLIKVDENLNSIK